MINEVLNLVSEFSKSIGFDNVNLYISNLQFESMDGLRNQCNDSGKRASQNSVTQHSKNYLLMIVKMPLTYISIKSPENRKAIISPVLTPDLVEPFVKSLAQQARMNNSPGTVAKKRDFTKFYISIVGAIIFVSTAAWAASWPRTGGRSQLIKLMQDIGPMGVCIIGGIILFQMYRFSKRPANQDVFEKQ